MHLNVTSFYLFLFVPLLLSFRFAASILLPIFIRRPLHFSLVNTNRIIFGPSWSVLYYLLQSPGRLEHEKSRFNEKCANALNQQKKFRQQRIAGNILSAKCTKKKKKKQYDQERLYEL